MPVFDGQINEQSLSQIVAYIKSLNERVKGGAVMSVATSAVENGHSTGRNYLNRPMG